MKKRMLIFSIIAICIAFSACGVKEPESIEESISQNKSETESINTEISSTESAEELEENTETILVETQFGSLSYPKKWEDELVTNETEENRTVSVQFCARINDQEYSLFDVMISEEDGDSVGTITDSTGITRNVYVNLNEISGIEAQSDEVMDQLYAMQEGVNVLIDSLE